MKKKIHINQHKIRSNHKTGLNEPVITIKSGKTNTYCHRVRIAGPCTIVYSPHCPLSCGARVWIETDSDLVIDEGEPDAERRTDV